MTVNEIYTIAVGLVTGGAFLGRVNYKTNRNTEDLEKVKDDQREFHRKVYTALNDINVTLGRMDERIKSVQSNVSPH